MIRWLNGLQPWGVVALRLVLGVTMVYHSWDKVYPGAGGLTHGHLLAAVEHFNDYVVRLGLPRWLGYLSTAAEFVGGICMLLGFLTRFWAFLILCNMLVALVLVNVRHGYAASEYSLALVAIALMILLAGPERMAVDRRLGVS
jgi:putative oxidoreductase